jgi:hypothetical protein
MCHPKRLPRPHRSEPALLEEKGVFNSVRLALPLVLPLSLPAFLCHVVNANRSFWWQGRLLTKRTYSAHIRAVKSALRTQARRPWHDPRTLHTWPHIYKCIHTCQHVYLRSLCGQQRCTAWLCIPCDGFCPGFPGDDVSHNFASQYIPYQTAATQQVSCCTAAAHSSASFVPTPQKQSASDKEAFSTTRRARSRDGKTIAHAS